LEEASQIMQLLASFPNEFVPPTPDFRFGSGMSERTRLGGGREGVLILMNVLY